MDEMKFEIWTILFLIPQIDEGLFEIQNSDIELFYNVTFFNHCQRHTFRIQVYHKITLSDCVTECGIRSHCEAMNYHTGLNMCELFTVIEEDFTPNGCSYIQRQDINVKTSPCGADCDPGLTCDINTRTCVIKECRSFPNPQNGVVLGNHKQIGARVITICSKGFYTQPSGEKYSYCSQNGQWSPVVTCTNELCIDGTCYKQYLDSDLMGSDLSYTYENTFEDCSKHCETEHPEYKSIEYCLFPVGSGMNCFCKLTTTQNENDLNDLIDCSFYHKIIESV